MQALLQIRDLSVQFLCAGAPGHRAVNGASFEIGAGEIVGLMGESGCGKSTTALALLGLLPGDSARVHGSALFCGKELLTMDERQLGKVRGAEISLVFQEPEIALSPVMRVGDQVAEVIRAHLNLSWRRCRAKARFALACVGLDNERIFAAYPHQLSGGQRQRIVLAQALACNPALLIADEPTASLDARNQVEFLALLRTLKNQKGLAVFLISHSPEVQARLADRLLVMKEGQIIEQGSFTALYRNPSHPYTRALMQAKSRRTVDSAATRAGKSHISEQDFAHIT